MFSCMPVLLYMVKHNAFGALHEAKAWDLWQLIDWQKATRIVRRLQARIVKAVRADKWNRVRNLQRLLTHSTSAKFLAIRRVTENAGKRAAGIDGVKWDTAQKKFEATEQLTSTGYKARTVRRIYIPKANGRKRPLGIPTMKDRAMQALYLLGLDPISETLADKTSYGFRRYRSCADAITKCHRLLVKRVSPQWILEGDIKGCFDNISHEWLMRNIPINNRILRQWLKSGYLEKRQLFPTESGTPQGSVISPTLANMVLDGMQVAIDKALGIRRKDKYRTYKNPYKVHLVRYADDFIVTASNREVLEQQVKPAIQAFLAERGLELSEHKTALTHIDEGFDFLGKHIRKYNGKLIIKPSRKNVQTFLHNIQQTFRKYRTQTTVSLLYRLNDKIQGWAMYHRMDNSKQTFQYVDARIWRMFYRWALRRHRNKGKKWVIRKYYTRQGNYKRVPFACDKHGHIIRLLYTSSIPIEYHIPVRGDANPYDPIDEMYFEKRHDTIMIRKIQGRKMLIFLYRHQKGACPVCKQKITVQTGWHTHHIIPKCMGGKYTYDNLVLLHPICHEQVHSKSNEVAAAVCFK